MNWAYSGRGSWMWRCSSSRPKRPPAELRTSERCFHYWAHRPATVWRRSCSHLTSSRPLCAGRSRRHWQGCSAAGFAPAGCPTYSSRWPDLRTPACSIPAPSTNIVPWSSQRTDSSHRLNGEMIENRVLNATTVRTKNEGITNYCN